MQLAFAIVGAAIGAALGPPGWTMLGMSAAAWGFMAGSIAGQMWVMAHQPTVNTQGPRLSDMKLSAGGYGAGIAKTYGSPRVNGNVIWSSDLIETANTQTYGSKKTGKQSVTTYTYSVDCAVGVCEGPILGFRRIWANGKLIYDITGAGPVNDNGIIPLSGMTFYLGTEEQTANSVMQSYLGAANVPAYRGLAYVVFNNLQLEKFGNRHPKFDFEIGTGERLYIGIDYYNEIPYFSTDLVNWSHRGNTLENYPQIYSYAAMCNGFNQFSVQGLNNALPGLSYNFRTTQNGQSWAAGTSTENYDLEYYISNLGRNWIYHDGQYMLIPLPGYMWNGYPNPTGAILTSSDGLNWNLADYFPTDHWIEGDSNIHDIIFSHTANSYVAVMTNNDSDENCSYIYASPKGDRTNFSLVGTISDVHTSFFDGNNLCEFNNLLWYCYCKESTQILWVASSPDGIVWTDRYQVPGSSYTYYGNILTDGQKLVLLYGGYYIPGGYQLRTRTSTDGTNWSGEYVITNNEFNVLQRPQYDGRRFYWSDIYDGSTISKLYFSDDGVNWSMTDTGAIGPDGLKDVLSISDGDFVQGSDTLADVITDICLSAGLKITDIDTGAIESIDVKGYIRTTQMAARAAIDPLLAVYDIDAYESDGQIKFLPKTSGHSGPTIAESDLGASTKSQSDGVVDTVNVLRVQELELPNEILVRYIDRSLDYDTNQQYARRLAGSSQGNMTVDAPVVFSATEALNLSNSILYRAWVQRDQYSFSTTQKYAAYEPTDMFGIPFGGQNHTVRITKKEEDGFLIHWSGVSEDLSIYDQNQTGSSGSNSTTPIIPMFCDTDLIIVETPVLRDEADYLGFLAIAGGQTPSAWPGGNLYIMAENGTPSAIPLGPLANRAITGTLTSALDPVTDPITADFDVVNTFDVTIPWGTLESRTAGEVLSGMNTCIVTHYDGSAEVLAFQTATLNSPGNYTLSNLLRRIRQNSSFSQNGSYQRFAMLTIDTVKPVIMQLNNLGNVYTFAGPAIGTSLDGAITVDCTLTGMSKKPLSPILLAASRQLNNDVTMSWTRRTRVGGSWPTGENGPLSEAYEAYEIDIMASNHTTVLRTLTSATPSVLYTIANQIADFGSQPNVIEVNIYQMSDWVGRGYPANLIFHVLDAGASIQANQSTTGAVS
jgi:hypothetical protein